jgi:hypothetical protein
MRFEFLAQRLFNVPLAITPGKAEVIMAALAGRLGIGQIERLGNAAPSMMEDDDYGYADPGRNARKGYEVVGGVAIVPVCGTLVQKLGTLRPYSGMTGYDGIRQNFLTALTNPDVQAIMLDIDSPGGEISGCFDLVDTIYKARGKKPIWSILNESAYSAAYAIASAADRIVVPRTGGVGSIGVIWMHMDWSKALTSAGFKVTFITYGDLKADGHPEIPLSEDARKRFRMLTAGAGLSGSASASSLASGALTTSIALAGSASCSSSASGTLSTTPVGAALSGSASATSSASGSLTTAIMLAGAAVAQASASGSFAVQAAALSGAAVSSSSASGSLSTQIVVAGAAQAVASAVGSLTTAIRLAGAAACSSSASASGSLSTGLLPPEPNPHRMIVVPRRTRHFVARRRARHFEVGR